MKVFISWSGKVSHKAALALKDWLPSVIQSVDAFVSSEDIEKGARWFPEIGAQLEATKFGILCLTPENLSAPWLLFEAGALSKALLQARVSPLLIGVAKADVTGPLAQFQMTEPTYEDVLKLMLAINGSQSDGQQLSEQKLSLAFSKWWSDFDTKIVELVKEAKAPGAAAPPAREVRDIVEEILDTSRGVSQEIQKQGQYLAGLLRHAMAEEERRNVGFRGGLLGFGRSPSEDFFGRRDLFAPTVGLINRAMEKTAEQPREKEKDAEPAKPARTDKKDTKKE